MEDVLDLYGRELPAEEVMICFDEHSYSMHSHVTQPLPTKPSKPARVDYEYKREGTCNIFIAFAPALGWRKAVATNDRKALTTADFLAELREDFPNRHIRLVADQLNTHCDATFYKAFPPQKASALRQAYTWHHTPKHGSWLNMAEIEIGVMLRQCLDRRISNIQDVQHQLDAWQAQRNNLQASVDWTFTNDKARDKLKSLYSEIFLR